MPKKIIISATAIPEVKNDYIVQALNEAQAETENPLRLVQWQITSDDKSFYVQATWQEER